MNRFFFRVLRYSDQNMSRIKKTTTTGRDVVKGKK